MRTIRVAQPLRMSLSEAALSTQVIEEELLAETRNEQSAIEEELLAETRNEQSAIEEELLAETRNEQSASEEELLAETRNEQSASDTKCLSIVGTQLPTDNSLNSLIEIFNKAPHDLTSLIVIEVPMNEKVISSLCDCIIRSKSLRHLSLNTSLNDSAKKQLFMGCLTHPALEQVHARYTLPEVLKKQLTQNASLRQMRDLVEIVKEVGPTSETQRNSFHVKMAKLANCHFNYTNKKQSKYLVEHLESLLITQNSNNIDTSDSSYASPPSPTFFLAYDLEESDIPLKLELEEDKNEKTDAAAAIERVRPIEIKMGLR